MGRNGAANVGLPERAVLSDPQDLIERALGGQRAPLRELVDVLTPPIQGRVARVLMRSASGARRGHVRADVEDIVQHVLGALFADGGRALRTWDAERGLSLQQYVALIAEREAISILRSKRRNPYTEAPTDSEALEARPSSIAPPDSDVLTRQMTGTLLSRLRTTLSPLGVRVFELLFCDEKTPEVVCAELGITTDALYAWRTRIRKMARQLATELSNESGQWVQS